MGCLFSVFENPKEDENEDEEDNNKILHLKELYELYNVQYETADEYSPPSYYNLINKGND